MILSGFLQPRRCRVSTLHHEQHSWGVELVRRLFHGDNGPRFFWTKQYLLLLPLHGSLSGTHEVELHREDPLTTHLCPGNSIENLSFITQVTAKLTTVSPGEHPDNADSGLEAL